MPPPTSDWPRALALLDEALALPAAQREPWLAHTAAHEPQVLPLLRKLLAAHGRVEAHALLATLPKLQRDPAQADSGRPGLRVGPFELIEPLGRGGMGSVWRARHADGRIEREVAVKLPAAGSDPAALAALRARFARERDFLAQLEHPHIARLYDAGVSDDGQPFLAMELVAGQPIDRHCDAQRLGLRQRLALFLQVTDAVDHAHQQLVLHRDLKPGNVLVDARQQVRLLDFGIARLLPPPAAQEPQTPQRPQTPELAAPLTEQAGVAFTLGHAAPEQLSHGALSTATDVYALGVMLYQLLTGLSPYQPARDSRGALEDAVLLATPAASSTRAFEPAALAARQTSAAALRQALRGDLDVILGQALKKNPAERYPTAAALADDLRRHLARQPIGARADSWRYRARLFVARNRLAVAATALATTALVATTSLAVWQAGVSARHAETAIREAERANAAQQFFASLLSNADPEKNTAITAVDRSLVDRALATAERDFAAAPRTLVLVLKQLGDIYFRLGLPAPYLDVQRQRVKLLRAMPDAPADERVDAELTLGWASGESTDAAERAQALPRLQAAYKMALAAPASPAVTVRVLCALADQYSAELRHADADAQARLAVAHAEKHLPDPHPMLAFAHEARGVTAAKLGRFDAARASFRRSIAVDATGRGRGLVDRLATRSSLANLEYEAGRYTAARDEALAALAFARQNLGATEGTLTPLRLRAVFAAERAGDADAAAQLAQPLLADDLASGDAFRAGRAHYALGVVAVARADLAGAAQAFALAAPGLAADPTWQRNLALELAGLALRRGQPAQALERLLPVIATLQADGHTDSTPFARASERAGVALARLGRLAEARARFDDACRWRRATFAASHPERTRCESYLILASAERGSADGQNALAQQRLALLRDRDDRPALASSLQAAQRWLAQPPSPSAGASGFPYLD